MRGGSCVAAAIAGVFFGCTDTSPNIGTGTTGSGGVSASGGEAGSGRNDNPAGAAGDDTGAGGGGGFGGATGGDPSSGGSDGGGTGGMVGGGTGGSGTGGGGTGGGGMTIGELDPLSGCRYTLVASPAGADSVVVDDFDGDGRKDIAFGDARVLGDSEWGLAWGVPDGFSEPEFEPVEVNPNVTAYADFNGDGIDDLVFIGLHGTTHVFFGDKSGSFSTLPSVVSSGPRGKTVAADFDSDGNVDLLYGWDNDLSLSLGNGDGTFNQGEVVYVYPLSGDSTGALAAADLDENGTMDAVLGLASTTAGSTHVLLGDGEGTFTVADRLFGEIGTVLLKDFNHDQRLDVVGPLPDDDSVGAWLGVGDAQFEIVTGIAPSTGTGAYLGTTGDLNADGHLDLVVGNTTSRDVSVLLGNGDGTFQPETRVDIGFLVITAVGMADLDDDGMADFLISTPEGVRIYFGPCPAAAP